MKRSILFLIGILLIVGNGLLQAQIPYHSPNPSNNPPLDFSNPIDIILYIVLPILVLIFAIIAWRYKKNRNS